MKRKSSVAGHAIEMDDLYVRAMSELTVMDNSYRM
jgi:hypothetical protein